ncbi:MAG: hypothetical protein H6865_00800 [Rhodospirillales bacterium]|nr:hypothetical protein [Rhodospirillales bacterium]USO07278.1 MAG: hypothetical protein H6866_07570 [Rhodospirillales bacterium]
MTSKKFEFPARGFYIVADKVAEADYFLEGLKHKSFHDYNEFGYQFSAFVSAARSITYALQAVMKEYPNFQD